MKNKPMFQIIDGTERYKVTDLYTKGEAFFDNKLDAYKHAHILVNVLKHTYLIEDRGEKKP